MLFRSRGLALVTRKSADAPSALAATEGFRRLCPDDPVRYDFVLSRFGNLLRLLGMKLNGKTLGMGPLKEAEKL